MDMANAFIQKIRDFTPLTNDEEALLAAACENARPYPARSDLVREGDRAGPVFVFLEGWGCQYKITPDGGRQIVSIVMPGDVRDLHSDMLTEMDHSTATLTAALVATIERPQISELMARNPTIARALLWIQLVDTAILRSWIINIGRRDSLSRVAHLMCELYYRAHDIGVTDDTQCVMPLTHNVVADALGLTPIHVSRMLRKLKEAGVMEIRSGSLLVNDIGQLSLIAGFEPNYLQCRKDLSD